MYSTTSIQLDAMFVKDMTLITLFGVWCLYLYRISMYRYAQTVLYLNHEHHRSDTKLWPQAPRPILVKSISSNTF